MIKRAVGEASEFSRRVVRIIEDAVGKSGVSISQFLAEAGMSRNYYYTRLRGEKPFNTNDIEAIADALGLDAMEILMGAAQPTGARVTEIRPKVTDEPNWDELDKGRKVAKKKSSAEELDPDQD
ncbi:helix-turn-helix domain-containing protein [Pseudoclavibacter sp. RFBB5]|uniref:helix-turn-helix domain-containing protein n=1 Tax=Pseudoclavibacter sp. RFBB5 TaxID=2080574 RepID=UPI000CE77734|nr:helix-turn-helix domain-containing protein [Pseudoclavibacter sp. RFBB5]PPG29681.1 hypothetical protein C5B97_11980 [Pseudoclavibacter sp. RFBB5]